MPSTKATSDTGSRVPATSVGAAGAYIVVGDVPECDISGAVSAKCDIVDMASVEATVARPTAAASNSPGCGLGVGKPIAIVKRVHAKLPVKCAAQPPFVSETALHGDLLEA